MKDKMLAFMASQPLCVISTVSRDAKPESALVAFSSEDLTLFVGTSSKTRKYQNIMGNKNVAVVIGNQTALVQYEGVAEEIKDKEYEQLVATRHIEKVPASGKFADDPTQVYFKITPTWIRFISHGNPDALEEFTEFA